jgi:hypothetical protein
MGGGTLDAYQFKYVIVETSKGLSIADVMMVKA